MAGGIDLRSLSEVERAALDRANSGAVADFSQSAEKPLLRAAFLASLALASPPRGIRIKGARIDGALDLSDCALPALALEACDLTGQIDLSAARLGRLSIKASRFSGLRARGAAIDGEVDFSAARAFASESWIDLGSASIRGSINGCDAELLSPPPRPKSEVPPWDHNYALRLSDAHATGSVQLNGKFVARGGLCLDNAHIRGSVWARGATIAAGEGDDFHPGDAIHAHCAAIDGMLALNFGFSAVGRVWLLGAHIGDRLTVGFDAKLVRGGESYDWGNRAMNQAVLLLFDQAEIGGSVHIADFSIAGAISLTNARVGADASFIAGRIGNRTADGRGVALTAEGARIDGNVTLGRSLVAEGKVSFAHARVAGGFDCRGAELANRTEDGRGVALDAEWMEVAHGILPAGLAASGAGDGFSAQGRVSFAHARITAS